MVNVRDDAEISDIYRAFYTRIWRVWRVFFVLFCVLAYDGQRMKVLGIDPGYAICGYAVLSGESLVSFGAIRTPAGLPFSERLREIGSDIEALLDRFQPDLVGLEGLHFVQNVTTGLQVAQVRGVILYLCAARGIRVLEPKPTAVKASFTGDGAADKQAVQRMARHTFGVEPALDDAADAIAVAWWTTKNKLAL